VSAADNKPEAKRKRKTLEQVKGHNPAAGKSPEQRSSGVRNAKGEKSLKIEEALRQKGIDESKVAQGYASLHEKLGASADKGDLKLFFDVLKENSRILEPPHRADGNSTSENVTVVLRHTVARPVR
jgi:hypothetical protein